jgi:hypothetical protein
LVHCQLSALFNFCLLGKHVKHGCVWSMNESSQGVQPIEAVVPQKVFGSSLKKFNGSMNLVVNHPRLGHHAGLCLSAPG